MVPRVVQTEIGLKQLLDKMDAMWSIGSSKLTISVLNLENIADAMKNHYYYGDVSVKEVDDTFIEFFGMTRDHLNDLASEIVEVRTSASRLKKNMVSVVEDLEKSLSGNKEKSSFKGLVDKMSAMRLMDRCFKKKHESRDVAREFMENNGGLTMREYNELALDENSGSKNKKNKSINNEGVLKEIEAMKTGIQTINEFVEYLGYIVRVLTNVIDDWIDFFNLEDVELMIDVMASMKYMLQKIFTSLQL
ncbi:hypothetical protein ROZALSC1DRAFT_31676 [Rozella allomycis CSF55]|uniref:Uncharacterized protein n=1 Tax=Rozella allomycis (strain CSF55) TaxID=988480 RepID=A0A4V1IZ03_ROZAC|nr:hypothetical protein ROZALSC1DRAFT_31676 [Rozella allomycis CSF55]